MSRTISTPTTPQPWTKKPNARFESPSCSTSPAVLANEKGTVEGRRPPTCGSVGDNGGKTPSKACAIRETIKGVGDGSTIMSAGHDYYQQVLAMGHTPENALAYTRQHYPDFIPGRTQAVAAPVVAPLSQQSIPAATPTPQAVVPAPMTASPVQSPPLAVAGVVGLDPHAQAYAPMPVTLPATGATPPMVWAAVACVVLALLLSMMGQFSNGWLVNNEDEGFQAGLRNLEIDCSQEGSQADIDTCKNFAYAFLAEDLQEALASNTSASSLDDVQVGSYENYCKNVYEFSASFAMGNQSQLNDIAKARDTCLETPAAGSTGGVVLWLGSLAALVATTMLVAGALGRPLPGQAQQHGHWAGIVAGALILLAVLVWWLLLPDSDIDTRAGAGVWMTVIAGILALAGGVMALLEGKKTA